MIKEKRGKEEEEEGEAVVSVVARLCVEGGGRVQSTPSSLFWLL